MLCLIFTRPVQFSRSVYPICLPPRSKTFTNTRAYVIGWGTIYFGGPTSNLLQEVNVRVWDNAQCATNYGRLNRKVTDSMLCAGNVLAAESFRVLSITRITPLEFFFNLLEFQVSSSETHARAILVDRSTVWTFKRESGNFVVWFPGGPDALSQVTLFLMRNNVSI